jgi:hypothetical protein
VNSARSLVVAALLASGLAGCGGKPGPAGAGEPAATQDAGYLAPPAPEVARPEAGGLALSGYAPPGGKVRLATPGGEAMFVFADAQGRWRLWLTPVAEPRIFGLSVSAGGRQVQAQGYVLVTPKGQAALLRSGAGALRIDTLPAPGLRAIDFDRGGGLEVSAWAAPGATVVLRLDGRQVAQGRADAAGRYDASLPATGQPAPVRPGRYLVQVAGDGFADSAAVLISPPAPLAQGPFSSQLTPAGLRVDWMTPGGGVQSTILVH